ncbi:MAG: 50S ribosomal protein L11 [Planctomycetes bacterium]|nr:50S ribosomal protein L11 [Planctomycetota bacterium]
MPPKKEVMAKIKLQCPGGQATPAPPVGPALGQHGVNIGEFVKRFNDATRKDQGLIIPCIVTVYKDRTFEIAYKTPPASVLLKKYANVVKGSGTPNKEKVGSVSRAHVEEIARIKLKDLNAPDLARAVRVIEGTARNMGIKVEG